MCVVYMPCMMCVGYDVCADVWLVVVGYGNWSFNLMVRISLVRIIFEEYNDFAYQYYVTNQAELFQIDGNNPFSYLIPLLVPTLLYINRYIYPGTEQHPTAPIIRAAKGTNRDNDSQKSSEIITLLSQYGADLNRKSRYGLSALDTAKLHHRATNMKTLMELGAKVDANRLANINLVDNFSNNSPTNRLLGHWKEVTQELKAQLKEPNFDLGRFLKEQQKKQQEKSEESGEPTHFFHTEQSVDSIPNIHLPTYAAYTNYRLEKLNTLIYRLLESAKESTRGSNREKSTTHLRQRYKLKPNASTKLPIELESRIRSLALLKENPRLRSSDIPTKLRGC